MSARIAVVAFAAALLLCGPASANTLFLLHGPTYACADLRDAARAERTPQDELISRGCLRLTGSYYADDSASGFVCLRLSRRSCLWVPSTAVSRGLDDGVF
jgi:hypothetical protein